MCIASNESKPGISLAYVTAAAIIDSLTELQKTQGVSYRTPTLLDLRAAPVNPIFAAQMPAPVRFILNFCLHYCYEDHAWASQLYESSKKESPNLLEYIFVDPPALHDADGTERTGYKLVLHEQLPENLSYADLGAAFCELAERRGEFKGKGVGVGGTGRIKMTWGANIGFMLGGAKNRILAVLGLA